ncbi:glycosyltransferase family 4 protein [Streptomyces sp. ODS28]|uniref:glycosyltransferase family 4 protein n=1 Tax=Streptomyces sp. ODS28 TaxID=3136688 RepID=UPI0031F196AE
MSRRPTPSPSPPPSVGRALPHAVQVIAGTDTPSASTVAHVRSLSAGLVARGLRVTVCGPLDPEQRAGFAADGAGFASAPARTEPEAVAALRRACADADLVHAHGLRAGLLAGLALGGRRRRVPLVVTWHGRGTARGGGVRERLGALLERRVARSCDVLLGATADLVERARTRGARDARLSPVATARAAGERPGAERDEERAERLRHKARAEVGAVDRPLVFSVGRLDAHHAYGAALTAARGWRAMDPPPLLAIAGEGGERAALQRRIDEEALPARLLGRRDDAFDLLAGADVALLSSAWESRSLFAQEALHRGIPLVATAVGGTPELVGGAAELIPHADPDALSTAVGSLLADPSRRETLSRAGRARTGQWPTEDDTLTQVLSVYDELTE